MEKTRSEWDRFTEIANWDLMKWSERLEYVKERGAGLCRRGAIEKSCAQRKADIRERKEITSLTKSVTKLSVHGAQH